MIESILKNIGLNEREAKIYIELLKIGAQPASSLSRVIKIPRTSAQFTAETLVKKGFVKKFIKNRTTYYLAEQIDHIKRALNTKVDLYKKKVEGQKNDLDAAILSLKKAESITHNRSKVIFYEGVENAILSYWELIRGLKEGDVIYNYVSPATEDYPDFRNGMKEFIKERLKRKIEVKLICTYCEDAIRLKSTDLHSRRETRVSFQKPEYNFFSEIAIAKDRVLSTSYSSQGLFSNIIYDKNIAEMQKAIFDLAWRQAKKDEEETLKTAEAKKLTKKFKDLSEY